MEDCTGELQKHSANLEPKIFVSDSLNNGFMGLAVVLKIRTNP